MSEGEAQEDVQLQPTKQVAALTQELTQLKQTVARQHATIQRQESEYAQMIEIDDQEYLRYRGKLQAYEADLEAARLEIAASRAREAEALRLYHAAQQQSAVHQASVQHLTHLAQQRDAQDDAAPAQQEAPAAAAVAAFPEPQIQTQPQQDQLAAAPVQPAEATAQEVQPAAGAAAVDDSAVAELQEKVLTLELLQQTTQAATAQLLEQLQQEQQERLAAEMAWQQVREQLEQQEATAVQLRQQVAEQRSAAEAARRDAEAAAKQLQDRLTADKSTTKQATSKHKLQEQLQQERSVSEGLRTQLAEVKAASQKLQEQLTHSSGDAAERMQALQQQVEQRLVVEQQLLQRLAFVEQELAVHQQSTATLTRRQEGLMKMAAEYQQKAEELGQELEECRQELAASRGELQRLRKEAETQRKVKEFLSKQVELQGSPGKVKGIKLHAANGVHMYDLHDPCAPHAGSHHNAQPHAGWDPTTSAAAVTGYYGLSMAGAPGGASVAGQQDHHMDADGQGYPPAERASSGSDGGHGGGKRPAEPDISPAGKRVNTGKVRQFGRQRSGSGGGGGAGMQGGLAQRSSHSPSETHERPDWALRQERDPRRQWTTVTPSQLVTEPTTGCDAADPGHAGTAMEDAHVRACGNMGQRGDSPTAQRETTPVHEFVEATDAVDGQEAGTLPAPMYSPVTPPHDADDLDDAPTGGDGAFDGGAQQPLEGVAMLQSLVQQGVLSPEQAALVLSTSQPAGDEEMLGGPSPEELLAAGMVTDTHVTGAMEVVEGGEAPGVALQVPAPQVEVAGGYGAEQALDVKVDFPDCLLAAARSTSELPSLQPSPAVAEGPSPGRTKDGLLAIAMTYDATDSPSPGPARHQVHAAGTPPVGTPPAGSPRSASPTHRLLSAGADGRGPRSPLSMSLLEVHGSTADASLLDVQAFRTSRLSAPVTSTAAGQGVHQAAGETLGQKEPSPPFAPEPPKHIQTASQPPQQPSQVSSRPRPDSRSKERHKSKHRISFQPGSVCLSDSELSPKRESGDGAAGGLPRDKAHHTSSSRSDRHHKSGAARSGSSSSKERGKSAHRHHRPSSAHAQTASAVGPSKSDRSTHKASREERRGRKSPSPALPAAETVAPAAQACLAALSAQDSPVAAPAPMGAYGSQPLLFTVPRASPQKQGTTTFAATADTVDGVADASLPPLPPAESAADATALPPLPPPPPMPTTVEASPNAQSPRSTVLEPMVRYNPRPANPDPAAASVGQSIIPGASLYRRSLTPIPSPTPTIAPTPMVRETPVLMGPNARHPAPPSTLEPHSTSATYPSTAYPAAAYPSYPPASHSHSAYPPPPAHTHPMATAVLTAPAAGYAHPTPMIALGAPPAPAIPVPTPHQPLPAPAYDPQQAAAAAVAAYDHHQAAAAAAAAAYDHHHQAAAYGHHHQAAAAAAAVAGYDPYAHLRHAPATLAPLPWSASAPRGGPLPPHPAHHRP